jgi:hypothetical protein
MAESLGLHAVFDTSWMVAVDREEVPSVHAENERPDYLVSMPGFSVQGKASWR